MMTRGFQRAALYTEALTIVAAGDAGIDSLADLKGRRVNNPVLEAVSIPTDYYPGLVDRAHGAISKKRGFCRSRY